MNKPIDDRTQPARGATDIAQQTALATRLMTSIEPVSRAATSFVGFFGWMAGLSLVGALVISLVTVLPMEPFAVWKLGVALLTVVVLALPGIVLVVFRVGLQQIVRLPSKLASATSGLAESSRDSYAALSSSSGGRVSRLLLLVRSLVEARSLLEEGRDLLFTGAALVRVANPIVVVVVLASLLLSAILIGIAVIVGAVSVF